MPPRRASRGATRIWAEAPGNLSCVWAQGDADATEAAFGAAPHVVEIELVNNRVVVNTIEPRGALGVYDAESGRYTLYINSQRVHGARAVIAGILGIGEERLRVLSYDLGGGFGMKYFTYPEQVLVAWAARRLGRPVRWLCGRQEGFISDTQARDHLTRAALALDDDGGFLGLRVRTLANLGAYVSNLGPISPTLLYTRMLANAYRLPAIHAEVEGVLTNTVFTDAYRGRRHPRIQLRGSSAWWTRPRPGSASRPTPCGATGRRPPTAPARPRSPAACGCGRRCRRTRTRPRTGRRRRCSSPASARSWSRTDARLENARPAETRCSRTIGDPPYE